MNIQESVLETLGSKKLLPTIGTPRQSLCKVQTNGIPSPASTWYSPQRTNMFRRFKPAARKSLKPVLLKDLPQINSSNPKLDPTISYNGTFDSLNRLTRTTLYKANLDVGPQTVSLQVQKDSTQPTKLFIQIKNPNLKFDHTEFTIFAKQADRLFR